MGKKVCILTNYILDYRRKMFNELTCSSEIILTVLELQSPKDDGRIIENKHSKGFISKQIPRIRIGKFILNDPSQLLRNVLKSEVIVINDNLPNIISNLIVFVIIKFLNVFRKGSKYKIVYWTEDMKFSNRYINLMKRYTHHALKNIFLKYSDRVLVFTEDDYNTLMKDKKKYL